MNNTIILKKGTRNLTNKEHKNFQKGDAVYGLNVEPEELKRWNIADKSEALKELSKHRCSYRRGCEDWQIEEFALEYCECNENGEFISGSDYDLAEEE